MWHGSIRSPEIAEQAAYYGDGFFHNHIFWPASHAAQMVKFYRELYEHYGHGRAQDAIVGLGGQVFMANSKSKAMETFRPYFNNAPVYGGAGSLEDYSTQTPLTVGTPEEVIERTLGFRKCVGDYHRQLFLIDHAGLQHDEVMRQIELLGTQVVPELRKEMDARRADGVADTPTHASLAAARGEVAQGERPAQADTVTGTRAEER